MPLSVVRRSDTLPWNPDKIGIEFGVGVFVVEDRYGISARRDPHKFTYGMLVSNWRIDVSKGLLALFWKAVSGGIERADHLALVITQCFDLKMNYIWLRTHVLCHANLKGCQEGCEKSEDSPSVSHRSRRPNFALVSERSLQYITEMMLSMSEFRASHEEEWGNYAEQIQAS